MAAKSNLLNMVLVLGLTCLLCSAILGGAYAITKDPIDKAAEAKTARSIGEVLPEFAAVEEGAVALDNGLNFDFYKATDADDALVGYAVKSTVSGFGGPLTLLVGITPDGIVYNTSVLSHTETPGLGAKCQTDSRFMEQWKGLDPSVTTLSVKKDGGSIDAITASTITSRAYTQAVSNALEAFASIRGDVSTALDVTDNGGQSNE